MFTFTPFMVTFFLDTFTCIFLLLIFQCIIYNFSLETVAQDVRETQEDVDQLDERVTNTEGAVVGLTTRVDEHDENIEELGEGLDTVTQRVDFAEKDIEETKIKVEEVDMKVFICILKLGFKLIVFGYFKKNMNILKKTPI